MNKNERKSQENRVYELWFDFLKLGDPDRCSEQVKKDFGDVWNVQFNEWWPTHDHLFEKLDPFLIEILECQDDFNWFAGDEDIVMVAVNLLAPKVDLQNAFEHLLKQRHKGRVGQPKFEDLGWNYCLYSRPDVYELERTLEVYKCSLETPTPDEAEIEARVRLITKKGERAAPIWNSVDAPKIQKDREKAVKRAVNEQLKKAETIIRNVEQGSFPKFR